jgi:hypothetical protein
MVSATAPLPGTREFPLEHDKYGEDRTRRRCAFPVLSIVAVCLNRNVNPSRALNRCVANNFVAEVEESRGPIPRTASNSKPQLVDPKLEMVRAAGLLHNDPAVSGVRGFDPPDRVQRDEIDRRV